MDELSEEDRLTVARARKIQRFLSQPFQVAEVFTGHMGKLVPLKETIKGFQSILGGRFSKSHELQTMFLHCAPELHLQFSCCFFILVSPQVSTTLCPSRLSTWSAPSRKSFRRQRSWLRSTHKHPNNLNCCGEKRRGVLLVRSTSFVKHVKIQMYLSRHPERKFYLMFSTKDGIKHCLYTKQLVNCILPEGFKSCS